MGKGLYQLNIGLLIDFEKWMIKRMCKEITIYDIIPLLKDGYVAMNCKNKKWDWYGKYPSPAKYGVWTTTMPPEICSLACFNIKPFEGYWKDSLIKIRNGELKEER